MAKGNALRRRKVGLTLFLAGYSANSLAARTAVEACLASPELSDVELTVVDVRAQPEAARHHGVVATPTVLVKHAGRSLRLVGDMSRGDLLQDLLRAAAVGR